MIFAVRLHLWVLQVAVSSMERGATAEDLYSQLRSRKMFTFGTGRQQIALTTIAALIVLMLVVLLSQYQTVSSQGNGPLYSISAMACTPNGETARAGLIDTSHGNARFANGRSGTAYLICPVTDATLEGRVVNRITLTVSGGSSDVQVSAALRASDRRNDNVRNVLAISTPCLGNTAERFFNCHNNSSSHRLDFSANYYYVQISITKSSSNSESPRIYGVMVQ